MSKGLGVLIFLAGAAVGSLVTWKLTQKRVDELAREEIESVKAAYSSRETAKTTIAENEKPDIMSFYSNKQKDRVEYEKKIVDEGYKQKNNISAARVISPEEFGENEDYEQISVTLRADDTLVYDDGDEVVTNPDELFGEGYLDQMGKYEEDCLHIVNDERSAYYEILREER